MDSTKLCEHNPWCQLWHGLMALGGAYCQNWRQEQRKTHPWESSAWSLPSAPTSWLWEVTAPFGDKVSASDWSPQTEVELRDCREYAVGLITHNFYFCCYYYWAVSQISAEYTQVCTKTQALLQAVHLPRAGASLGLHTTGPWICWNPGERKENRGSLLSAAPHKSEYSRMGFTFQFLIDVPAWLSLHSRLLLSHGVTFRQQNCPGTITNSTRQLSSDGSSGPMLLVTGRSIPKHRFSSMERSN